MNGKIWLIGAIFAFVETAYFGWNWTSKSDAEFVADMVATALFALALVIRK